MSFFHIYYVRAALEFQILNCVYVQKINVQMSGKILYCIKTTVLCLIKLKYVIPSTIFFVNAAKNIGTDCVDVNSKHPSIVKICGNNKDKSHVELFSFHPLDNNFVSKCINKLGMKEATGIDSISAKIVKLSHEQILNPVTNIVNFVFHKVFSQTV